MNIIAIPVIYSIVLPWAKCSIPSNPDAMLIFCSLELNITTQILEAD